MKPMTHQLSEPVSAAFATCGYDEALGTVSLSNRPDLCDYQCDGSFKGAKLYRKAPLAIAEEVAEKLRENAAFSKVEAVPPGFINLTLAPEFLIQTVNRMMAEDKLGVPVTDDPKTIVLDYGGPNIAKPLHIGHLRAAIIGEAVKRLMRTLGHTVIGDIHLGDWGLQIGLVIAELSERYPDFSFYTDDYNEGDALPPLTADALNELYPFASARSKTDEAFSEKAHRFTYHLQNRHPGFLAVWRLIWDTSVDDLRENYHKLGVDFDLWYGESDADKYVPEAIKILEDKGILVESQGAKVVEVAREEDKAPIPPAIIIKSDGAVNYETTDVATILQRMRDFDPDIIWYVVDKRQELHFTQVFRTVQKAGIVGENTELQHLGFGTMNGSDGKPYKTRDGGVMRLSDMIGTVTTAALEKIRESEYIAPEDQAEAAQKIGIAAIKFGDLINFPSKDYVFDLDKFLSFEGKTGTYILYMVTRINSVLKRCVPEDLQEEAVGGIHSGSERGLLLKLLETPTAFLLAAKEKAPNYVADNAYGIAVAFSQFYRENHILTEEDEGKRRSWLRLCRFVRELLTLHLDVLGIETVESM